jgi:hypothetical protein
MFCCLFRGHYPVTVCTLQCLYLFIPGVGLVINNEMEEMWRELVVF